jgi:light-regulated signal transduction histidine kinase (bacteriophytochrome)
MSEDAPTREDYEDLRRRFTECKEDLDQFAYAVSHDLQEPLRMISQYVSLIQEEILPVVEKHEDKETVEEAKLFCEYAVDGAARMRRMLDGLLSYSRAGRLDDTFETIDMGQAAKDAIAMLNGALKAADAEIHVGSLPSMNANRLMMTRVFLNLLSNAIKFRVPNRPLKIDVTVEERDDEYEFVVTDNGRGFDQQFADRIFVIYQRLDKKVKGTGIGLSVCRKIVERHGGRIWATSPGVGKGASFHFTVRKQS